MRLAVARLQGLVLPPRGVFSFWERIGAPVAGRGFVDGPSFLAGEVVATPGGGLCQLSGLLYNLALLAGCRVHERHPHRIDAYGEGRYVPLGRDADGDPLRASIRGSMTCQAARSHGGRASSLCRAPSWRQRACSLASNAGAPTSSLSSSEKARAAR